MKNRKWYLISAVTAAIIIPQQTYAESATTLPVVEVTSTELNPEITEKAHSYTTPSMSTATGFGLSIKETPQSVTVVTRERLDDQNIQTLGSVKYFL